MRRKIWISFVLIMLLTILAGLVDWPSGPDIKIGQYHKEIKVHQGLDLQGGVHLVYQLDMSKIDPKDRQSAQQGVANVIEKRINSLGVSEPVIQPAKVGNDQAVIVELPGITNVDEAINIIGKTAQLVFQEQQNETFVDTKLTGAHLKKASVTFNPQTNEPEVSLQFSNEGAKIFGDLTKKNLQKPLAIKLDNQIISAPTVQAEITDGKAVITGKFDVKEAKNLALELNSGALPVPINLVEQRNIGALLGSESVKKSLIAGLIGLLMVAIFIISYYRFRGLIAVMALIIYSILTLAIFKLIPVTLTLAGVAGFILSIGMAVDANILIFERMNEELREGKTIVTSIDEGFKRAWSSIRDSNISSLITCLFLFLFTTSLVKGFALTLGIGILVSMFTAITISRTLLKLILKPKIERG